MTEPWADEERKVITPALCKGLSHLCEMGMAADEAKERVCHLIDVMWGDAEVQRRREQVVRAAAEERERKRQIRDAKWGRKHRKKRVK